MKNEEQQPKNLLKNLNDMPTETKQNTGQVKNRITFRKGEETGIIIEKKDFEESLFFEQYKQSIAVLNDILNCSQKGDKLVSNVIAFCGDRGEGKTSALATIRNLFVDKSAFVEACKAQIVDVNKMPINENSFKVLNLIDPAFFDDKHNLLELLLGQMYAELKKNRKEDNQDSSDSFGYDEDLAKRTKMIQLFQDVRNSLSILKKASEKNAYDKLEEIDELACGIELREKINNLLHCYAKYFHKERVLICIDDLDLNVTEGYEMAEAIRKYLNSADVCVVVMAIKVNQMVNVVRSYLRKNMNPIVDNDTITDMAIRYVTKLLPQSHRVLMPTGEGLVNIKVKLVDSDKEEDFVSIKEAVVIYIYRKTRYIFVNGRNISPIVPTNLRSLRHLLGLLWDMPDAKQEDQTDNVANKITFKNYLYYTWTRCLSERDVNFIQELVSNEDLVTINKNVIMHLRNIILQKDSVKDNDEIHDDLMLQILNPQNTMQNVSVGDVFYVLNYLYEQSTSLDNTNLVFFIKAFYSIKLYDIYNYISESDEHLFIEEKDNKPSIYKFDIQLRKLNMLQRFLNGAYFTYNPGQLLPSERGGVPRDRRNVNGVKIIELFQELKNVKDSKEQLNLLHLCEFFALTTLYPKYSYEDAGYDRTKSSRSYFDNFSIDNKVLAFDVLSIFYNVVNIKFTYQRWNKVFKGDFYEFALERNSLLRQIIQKCTIEHPTTESAMDQGMHNFISESIIRFSEVLLSIMDNAINKRDVQRTGGNLFNIAQLYRDIQNIGITLYPLKEDKNRYEMKFHFLTPIIDWLTTRTEIDETIFNKYFVSLKLAQKEKDQLQVLFEDTILSSEWTYPHTGKEIKEKLSAYSFDGWSPIDWDAVFNDETVYKSKSSVMMELAMAFGLKSIELAALYKKYLTWKKKQQTETNSNKKTSTTKTKSTVKAKRTATKTLAKSRNSASKATARKKATPTETETKETKSPNTK